MTRREIISDLIDSVKQQYTDSLLSRKKVWNTFNRKLRGILEQQSKDKKLWMDSKLWKTFCIDLIEVDNNECGCLPPGLRSKIWRSKCELPKISSVSTGLLIKSILPIDSNIHQEIIFTTEVSAIRKKEIVGHKMYAFIKNNYLYILGEIETVSIQALFDEIPSTYCGKEISKPNSDSSNITSCKNPFLDSEVGVSDYVLEKAMMLTLDEIFKSFMRAPEIPPINTSPI
jgi:hypothetical protein